MGSQLTVKEKNKMKLLAALFALSLGQKRSVSDMSEKRLMRLRLKAAKTATTTSMSITSTSTSTSTTTTTTATKPKPKRNMQRAKVNKYIGSLGERLEESLSNGFVAAEFGGRTLQHCFSCEAHVLPEHQAVSDVDVWKKCIEDGALQECYGMDKACETVERRYNKKPYYVRMGCKQQTSCIQQIPDWPFNNGECDPEGEGNSRCAACCDNTQQAQTRACNLDTNLDKKTGLLEHWNITSDIMYPQ